VPKLLRIRGRKRANSRILLARRVEPNFDANYTKPGQGASVAHPVSYFGTRQGR
jgi:hypothetical protein